MISMDEARDAVDERLLRLGEDDEALVRDVGLLCCGTDVRGPELAYELNRTHMEFVAYVARGDDVGAVLNGILNRIFWLGYALGFGAER